MGNLNWNILVTCLALPLMLFVVATLWRKLVLHSHPMWAHLALSSWLALIVVAFVSLLQVNVELIHIPQYALLAVLFNATGCRLSDSMILALMAGILDEGVQYFSLHSHWRTYFDYNDVVLNGIGAFGGAVILFIWLAPDGLRHADTLRKERCLSLTIVERLFFGGFALTCMATLFGFLSPIAQGELPDGAINLRRNETPDRFWLFTGWGQRYHEVQFVEVLPLILLLVLVIVVLDRVACTRRRAFPAGSSRLQTG